MNYDSLAAPTNQEAGNSSLSGRANQRRVYPGYIATLAPTGLPAQSTRPGSQLNGAAAGRRAATQVLPASQRRCSEAARSSISEISCGSVPAEPTSAEYLPLITITGTPVTL